jgi:L-fuconolactonase
MKIDSHQHYWIYNKTEYSWINEHMQILKRDYLPSDLKTELQNSVFDGSIVVQARQSLEETRWLLELAASNSFIKGVIGWVDLCSNDIRNQLEEFSTFLKFRGVRHVIHDEIDDNFMLRNDFLNGISILKEYNLTYDILVFPKHLKNLILFAKQFPEQTFILDHIGKPNIKGKQISHWKEGIHELAEYQNIYCKLSGMVTEADWSNWKNEDFNEYLDVVFKAFGPDRLMIGSDWPVCLLGGSYSKVMGIVKNYISGYSESGQQQVLGLTAAKAYGI